MDAQSGGHFDEGNYEKVYGSSIKERERDLNRRYCISYGGNLTPIVSIRKGSRERFQPSLVNWEQRRMTSPIQCIGDGC
jgi:hypothetical protein